MKYKLAVFDMDGTILDTLDDLCDAVNYALSVNALPPRALTEVRKFVGRGIPKLIDRAVGEYGNKIVKKRVYCDFTRYYKENCNKKTRPYHGIPELLDKLKKSGVLTAVVSNKDDYAVKELCDLYFSGAFDFSIGRLDGVNLKPEPDMVNAALKNFGVERSDAVYIGDSDVDIKTAQNSGLDFIGVSWGFKGRVFLRTHGADTIVDTPDDIASVILQD